MNFNSFALHPTLLANLQAQGFAQPTPIQVEAIPPALAGRNLVGLAQTGTGKTAAFGLPILQHLLADPRRGTLRALIIAPTRELADQVNQAIQTLAQGTGLRSAAIYGGVAIEPQERILRNGLDLLVACPGRLLDLLKRGSVRLSSIEILVLDEADRMLDMGFLPDIRRLLAAIPSRRQTMLFSATLSPELEGLVATTAPNAARVQIGQVRPAHTIAHALYPVPGHHKTALLLALLRHTNDGSVLVFTRTKHRANRLLQQLAREGHSAAALHSNRSQNQRKLAMDGFRSGHVRILVATDIAARGIDVERVSHVINFDVPDTADAYIHRIGRTGRAERSGTAFTLVTPEDHDQVRAIERAVGRSIERRELAGFDYAAPAPPRAFSDSPIPRHTQSQPRHAQGQPRHAQGQPRSEQGQPRHAQGQPRSEQGRPSPRTQGHDGSRNARNAR
ncbi:MAG: DEAD/DEAH box helicase [Oscillochloridaceae bacterium umkhey_bin13]